MLGGTARRPRPLAAPHTRVARPPPAGPGLPAQPLPPGALRRAERDQRRPRPRPRSGRRSLALLVGRPVQVGQQREVVPHAPQARQHLGRAEAGVSASPTQRVPSRREAAGSRLTWAKGVTIRSSPCLRGKQEHGCVSSDSTLRGRGPCARPVYQSGALMHVAGPRARTQPQPRALLTDLYPKQRSGHPKEHITGVPAPRTQPSARAAFLRVTPHETAGAGKASARRARPGPTSSPAGTIARVGNAGQ